MPLRPFIWLLDEVLDRLPALKQDRWFRRGDWGVGWARAGGCRRRDLDRPGRGRGGRRHFRRPSEQWRKPLELGYADPDGVDVETGWHVHAGKLNWLEHDALVPEQLL